MKTAKQLVATLATVIALGSVFESVYSQDQAKSTVSNSTVVVISLDSSTDTAPQSLVNSVPSGPTESIRVPASDIPVKPGGTRSITFSVRRSGSGEVIPNSDITISLAPGTFNGGHLHSGTQRPLGSFASTSFNTGSSGIVAVVYTAPAIAGEVLINGSCQSGDGSSCTWIPGTIAVNLPGLQELGSSFLYDLTGAVPGKHESNHWGTAATTEGVANLAFFYYSAPETSSLTGAAKKLRINDMSLPWGGIYDCFPCKDLAGVYGVEWHTPHKEHQEGKNADVSKGNIPSR